MCGIAGYTSVNAPDERMKTAFMLMGIFMQQRGTDSWGWTNGVDVFKEIGEVQSSFTPAFTGHPTAFIHTRHGTTGKAIADNSHPFQVGDVLGMHNGIVYNHHALNKKYRRKCVVDSEHIFHHIAEGKSLSEIEAYGAIVYWRNGFLHAGRFNGGDLMFAKTAWGWIVCSTKWGIEEALQCVGASDMVSEFVHPDEGVLYRLNGHDLEVAYQLDFMAPAKTAAKWNTYVPATGATAVIPSTLPAPQSVAELVRCTRCDYMCYPTEGQPLDNHFVCYFCVEKPDAVEVDVLDDDDNGGFDLIAYYGIEDGYEVLPVDAVDKAYGLVECEECQVYIMGSDEVAVTSADNKLCMDCLSDILTEEMGEQKDAETVTRA